MLISADFLRQLGVRAPEPWAGPLSGAMAAQGITTPLRIAAFLANVLLETAMLSRLSESLDYTPHALVSQWPQHFDVAAADALGRSPGRPADQEGIAELAYGGRLGNRSPGSGDGWLFRGRGCLQHTGRANFAEFARAIGWHDPVEALPAWMETPQGACQSAAMYWQSHSCNALADRGDLVEIRRRINGGLIGLGVVTVIYRHALSVLRGAAVDPIRQPPNPPVLVQPGAVVPIPVPPGAGVERIATEALNEQSLTDAINQRPR
jgi:putative chitinase